MMFLHNYGNRMPPTMEDNPGPDINLAGSVSDSAIAVKPSIAESNAFLGSWSFENPYKLPPSQIAGSLLIKTFKVNASLSAGAASISLVDELVPVKSGTTDILTIGERISYDYRNAWAQLSESQASGEDSLALNFFSSFADSTFWIRDQAKWVMSLNISVSYSGEETTDDATVSNFEVTDSFPEAGILVTYLGKEFQLYGGDADDLGYVTGTITIEAEDYLSPLSS